MMMKTLFLLGSIASSLLSLAAADGESNGYPPLFEDFLAATAGRPHFNYQKQRVLEDAFGFNKADEGVELFRRCGRNNPCIAGLDCVATGGIGWKICMPMSCIEKVVSDYNIAQGNSTLFENYYYDTMKMASEKLSLPNNGLTEADLLNETTMALGEDAIKDGNYQFIIRDDARDALRRSLAEQGDIDPLDNEELQRQVAQCFPPTTGGNRGLQQSSGTPVATLPGFFFELAAGFQFLYGLGIVEDSQTLNGTFTVNDICFGLGPKASAGTGFLLQLWFFSDIGASEEWFNKAAESPEASITLPFPAFMIDLNAGLGPGIGLAYNTFAFLCHRLWFKFYLGAGGGLAFSSCIVNLSQ